MAWLSPRAGWNSQAQTGSSRVASMFTIRTRAGSASALKSVAVASASSSESCEAASGWQQAITSRLTLISTSIVTMYVDMSSPGYCGERSSATLTHTSPPATVTPFGLE